MRNFYQIVNKIGLGLALILAASAILLFSDLKSRQTSAPVPNPTVGQGARPGKLFRLRLVEYVETPNVEENRLGIRDGLKEAGLVEGRDYTLQVHNAQGDMTALNSMVDAVADRDCDLLLVSTTPALQVAIRKVKHIPVVFSLVANPLMAGAGRTPEDHIENITGTYVIAPHEEILPLLRQCVPGLQRIGTLFTPSEVNSVYYKELYVAAAEKAGLGLDLIGVSSPQEVPDAAIALCQRRIDALCQLSDNLSGAGFASIAQAALRAGVPVFSFATGHARMGAVLALARDFYDGGRESALLANRVMRGARPAALPFQKVGKVRLTVNLDAARQFGLEVPEAIRKRAGRIIDQGKTMVLSP